MMHRVLHNSATAVELQNAAELRRAQAPATPAAQQAGAQYNFAEIFGGANWGQTEKAAPAPHRSAVIAPSHGSFQTAIATATATVVESKGTGARNPVTSSTTTTETSSTAASTATSTAAATTSLAAGTTAPTAAVATAPTAATAAAVTTPAQQPGVPALVTAIMNGSFQPTYVTDPLKLQETNPMGVDYMPGFYYASDQTATQLAQLLGGSVVKMPPFGQDKGWTEPLANFIQLPSGQTFNAADVAYYAKSGSVGTAQLTADITATINEGAAWTQYYQQGGPMPTFASGYVGPAISGSSYASSMLDASGNVINPAFQNTGTKGA